jgi:uncharacterized protein YigA (DUF484 family)
MCGCQDIIHKVAARIYDLYSSYKVVLTDYRGDAPYGHFKEHKHNIQKTIGVIHKKQLAISLAEEMLHRKIARVVVMAEVTTGIMREETSSTKIFKSANYKTQ